jgi:hypothetical protein
MGNQQERSLAWLAGILDGEGSISVQVYNLPDGRVRLTPFISIVNSDAGIIAECRRVIEEAGSTPRICKKPMSTGAIAGVLACVNLRVDGMEPVKVLLEAVAPYLKSSKRRNAEKVLEYLVSRAERGITRNAKGHIRRAEYSRAEIELISSIRSHKRAKSSEAICQAPNVLG